MNILILNNNNPLRASGQVCIDLFNGLRKNGHNVKLLINNYDHDFPEGIESLETFCLYKKRKLVKKNKQRVEKLKVLLGFNRTIVTDPDYHFEELNESKTFFKTETILKKAGMKPDVVFVLFAKNFINTKNIFELYKNTNASVFWLMYDMAPFTGGCHYAWECSGYEKNCGRCPGLFSDDPLDLSYENLKLKKHYLDKAEIQIIAASEWQYRQVRRSSLFKDKKIFKILLSVDPNIFKLVDKKEVRQKMGIPIEKKIIFFGSVFMSQRRKGMQYLIDSLKILKAKLGDSKLKSDILLLIAGREIDKIADSLPFEYHFLGLVDNTFGIASAFQAADLFLCPSIEDSGPSMINQSMMCGTPVVSFTMGIAFDLVISGQTGYQAELKNSTDLADGIYNILTMSDEDYKECALNCRNLALQLCSPEVQMEKIEEIIKSNRGN